MKNPLCATGNSGLIRSLMTHFACLAMVCLGTACGGGSTTASGIAPARVAWCATPTVAFEDDGAAPPATLTQWPQAQGLLGFAPLLPARLPVGACLISGGGVVRNPIFGSRFSVNYQLAGTGALSFAEVPKPGDMPTPTCGGADPVGGVSSAYCQQTIRGVNVTLSSTLSIAETQHLMATLQATPDWVPAKMP